MLITFLGAMFLQTFNDEHCSKLILSPCWNLPLAVLHQLERINGSIFSMNRILEPDYSSLCSKGVLAPVRFVALRTLI